MCAMRLVLATGNAGKLKELRELLAPPAFEVLPQSQFTAASDRYSGEIVRVEVKLTVVK